MPHRSTKQTGAGTRTGPAAAMLMRCWVAAAGGGAGDSWSQDARHSPLGDPRQH